MLWCTASLEDLDEGLSVEMTSVGAVGQPPNKNKSRVLNVLGDKTEDNSVL
jgi:hypothetical protein